MTAALPPPHYSRAPEGSGEGDGCATWTDLPPAVEDQHIRRVPQTAPTQAIVRAEAAARRPADRVGLLQLHERDRHLARGQVHVVACVRDEGDRCGCAAQATAATWPGRFGVHPAPSEIGGQ